MPRSAAVRDSCRPCQAGESLVQIIIALAALALIAVIAVPGYGEHVRHRHRSAAKAFLAQVAQRQQQFHAERRRFAGSLADLQMEPPPAVAEHYAVEVRGDVAVEPGFVVAARPINGQSGDRCGALTISTRGVRRAAAANCW